jgi:SAM-dependent methyltransferase
MGAAVQGQLWGRAAFDWAELQEVTARPLWEAMLDAAAVGPNTHLLDAGCGAGGASALAARRGARVNGLDPAEALLAIARLRVPDGDFLLGDLEALPYADSTFNTIIAVDVLAYVIRPEAALRELRRVCRPEGQVLIAIWGRQEECEQHAMRVVGQRRFKTIMLEAITPFVTDRGGVCLVNRFRYIISVPASEEPWRRSAGGAHRDTGWNDDAHTRSLTEQFSEVERR